MKYTEEEVLQFAEENDVKFIKLIFCDIYGQLKVITVLSQKLSQIFREGFPIDSSKVMGFEGITDEQLILFPDLSTLALLPWRPQQRRVIRFFCNIKKSDGTPFECDSRQFLADAVAYARSKNYNFMIGTSCEFYVFEADENNMPTKTPHDFAGYCDASPADRGENLRRDICLTLEKMDIYPESSRHESGPGQNEIDFQCSSPLNAADNLMTFKNVVKTVASRNGMYATFMPKPLYGKSGNGLEIHITCMKNMKNIFRKTLGNNMTEAKKMITGILSHAAEMTLFFNSTTNSYARLGKNRAPIYTSWTQKNYPQCIKANFAENDDADLIFRASDSACNPYITIGLLIYACMDGIENDLPIIEPCDYDVFAKEDTNLDTLPLNLKQAADLAENSGFIQKYIPAKVLKYFADRKRNDWNDYKKAANKEVFESQKYFLTL
ncbi:MAG: glutamine synthetase family protein [Oscillospiraceae bacterium]